MSTAPTTLYRDVLIARVSKMRDNETSTETQVDEMTAFSHEHDGTVVGVFYERGKSAYKDNVRRDDLERAVRMIETGQANRLVIWKIDRLMRNVRRFNKVLERVENAGGHIVSKSEAWMDTTGPIGYAIVTLVAGIAEQESKNRSERITPWHGKRTKEAMTPGGPRPYGYDREPNKLIINKDEARVIREAAKRVVAGESLRGIAMDFNARGITTGKDSGWSHTLVKRILTSPTTAGKRTLGDGTFIDSTHWRAILDTATWTRCRVILMDPARTISTGNELTHFLSGALTCGKNECGGTMRHTPHSGGPRYRCATCGHSITANETESFVSSYLLSMVDDGAWQALQARGKMVDRATMDRMNAKLDTARTMWLNDKLNDEQWQNVQNDIAARLASLAQSDALDLPPLASLHGGWADAAPMDKRTICTTVFESITVNPRGVGVNGTARIEIRNRELGEVAT